MYFSISSPTFEIEIEKVDIFRCTIYFRCFLVISSVLINYVLERVQEIFTISYPSILH